VPRSKNAWSYISTPQYTLMAWCSVKNAQGQLYIYLFLLLLQYNNIIIIITVVIKHSVQTGTKREREVLANRLDIIIKTRQMKIAY